MALFDFGYFGKKTKRKLTVKKRTVSNKFIAWKLDKDYYDGNRNNGYGGFKYDGRWLKLLPKIIKKYKLSNNSKILDLGCKKGFIMKDLEIKSKIILSKYYDIPFSDNYFDLVIGFSSIYKYNFQDVVKTIKEIKRASKKSFFTVASYNSGKEKEIFDSWTLLGTTFLSKKDWKKLFKILGYKGDYYFTTAKSLNLY